MTTLSSLLMEKTPKYELKLPSTGKLVTYRPFLVKEEKILLIAQESKDNKEILLAIRDIIESCVDEISNADDMPLFDIEYIFLNLRAKSVGEIVRPIIICPHTKENISLELNITEIEPIKNKKHNDIINIADNIIVKMTYPTLSMLRNKDSMFDINESSSFYDLIVDCIKEIHTDKEVIKQENISREELESFVDCMNKSQFNLLLDFFLTSPRIEKTISYTTSDNIEREVTLSGLGDFFG